MINKVIGLVTVIVAVIIAVLAIIMPAVNVGFIVLISRFFEVMIPILAVGALLKYLLSGK